MEIKSVEKKNLKALEMLYLKSFPQSERKPFNLIKIWQKSGKMEILEISDQNSFCGLVITVLCEDLVLIDYLAISSELQGKGVGSAAIELIRKRYSGKRIFLEIETTLKNCADLENRLRRKHFYLKNGLTECGFSVYLFGVEMEILTFNSPITYDEYIKVYRHLAGNFIANRINRAATL